MSGFMISHIFSRILSGIILYVLNVFNLITGFGFYFDKERIQR